MTALRTVFPQRLIGHHAAGTRAWTCFPRGGTGRCVFLTRARRAPRSALAIRAEVAAAARYNHAADRATAPATRLAGPLINAQPGREVSRAPFNVDVVAEAGALKLDRALQDLLHRPMQTTGSLGGKPARLGQGMNPRVEERFIRVDV